MIENDVVFSLVLRADLPVDKGFRFGPYVAQNGDDEAIRNWMKSVSTVDNLAEANLRIVREGEEIYFEATKKIDASDKFCLWSKHVDGQSQPNLPEADSSLLLDIHIPGKHVYECKICHKLFVNKNNFISHKSSHTDEIPFKCTLCEQAYRWKTSLVKHIALIHVQKYKCRICKKVLLNQRKLSQHEQIHSGKMPFHCEQCGAGYRSSCSLKSHVEKIHSTFKCGSCGKVWNSKELLKQHQKSHEIDWQSSLQQISTKLKELNTVECDICHSQFQSDRSLLMHRQYHSDVMPFRCSICGQAFHRRGDLTRHAAGVHSQRYECHLCKKDYTHKKELTAHLAMHLDEKPFRCDECNAEYKTPPGLKLHREKIHNKFKCFCGEFWDSKESLEQHSKHHYMSVDSSSGG